MSERDFSGELNNRAGEVQNEAGSTKFENLFQLKQVDAKIAMLQSENDRCSLTPQSKIIGTNVVNGSPVLRSVKRGLILSFNTSVGLPRKHQHREQHRQLKFITFDEDIEMEDLDDQNKKNENAGESYTPSNTDRRVLRGLRRGLGEGSVVIGPSDGLFKKKDTAGEGSIIPVLYLL